MENNPLHIISLLLSIVLLVAFLWQGQLLKEYKTALDNELQYLETDLNHISDRLDTLTQALTQIKEDDQTVEKEPTVEDGDFVESFSVDAFTINIEEWKLETYVDAGLTEWNPDMKVTLIAEFDGETVSVPMERYNSNRFCANLSIPVDTPNEVMYKIQIEQDGKIVQQDVYAWVETFNLLGLNCSGCEIFGPDYENGVLTGDFSIILGNLSGAPDPLPLLDPHFEIFKNGELVQTLDAVQAGKWTTGGTCPYQIEDKGQPWQLEAVEGDQIVIRFRCHNEYGLGWDFHLFSFEIQNGNAVSVDLKDEPQYRFFRAG